MKHTGQDTLVPFHVLTVINACAHKLLQSFQISNSFPNPTSSQQSIPLKLLYELNTAKTN